LLTLKERIWKEEVRAKEVDMVCRSCAALAWGEEIKCDSRDCPVFYTRIREKSKLNNLRVGVGNAIEVLEDGIKEEYPKRKARKDPKGKGKKTNATARREGLDW
jgi:DNA polymerase zeta